MSQNKAESRVSRKRLRRLNKARVAVLLVIIFLVIGSVYAIFAGSTRSVAGLTTSSNGKVNVLVLGVDEREDDVGRSDTAFVVTIDKDEKKVTVLSIPRDSRVKIADHGWDKINHAYGFGGAKLSKETVENLLGIPINYTVVVNFNGFIHMIDAIGGVTVNIDKRMTYADPYDDDGGLYIDLQPGVQKLNGKKAIEYVRYRDAEGDIGRVARQQKFLKALLQEFTKPQLITKLPDLVKEVSKAVRTDMPTSEMVKLIPIVNEAAKAGLDTEWVSGTPIWIHDISYWIPDIKELRTKVAQIQGITVDEKYRRNTDQLANEYRQSIPREIKVVEVPMAVQRPAALEKQPVSTTNGSLESNNSKTESAKSSGKANSASKALPITNNSNPVVTEKTDMLANKNPSVDGSGK
jgi:cell envelope-related function transcriptional attenuator common domain